MKAYSIKESPAAVVEFVLDAREKNIPYDDITERLLDAGYSAADVAHVYEMIGFAFDRAFMQTLGGMFSADYDDCPYFQAALECVRKTMPPHMKTRGFQIIVIAAVTVSSLIGLAALGAMIYYTIDWWRSTH